jgi:hypothetical protein
MEIDTLTGELHEPGSCCLDIAEDGNAPVAPVEDTQTDADLMVKERNRF